MLKKNLNLKAVIFDMDGVITNTMPDHFKAWKTVLAQEGIAATQHDIYSREGQRGIQSVAEIFAVYQKSFTRQKAKVILKRKEELFKKIVRLRFIPGARRFLRDLHRRGFQLALVTGTSRHELHRILPDSLYNLFDIIVTGSDVRNGKPHPEPYLKVIRQLKVLSPRALAIENAPFGIRSAKAAGLRCLALETSLPREHLAQADAVFESYREMQKKIQLQLN
ncbi:MAG: hypothetical protein A3D10_04305 [Omnitrophica WOR_2 bacterium RIFCSPHIGHO2_02_FULL_48_11]|nr:MAG: hypothetical protein A3D10_04305 [Omnitrophica WOR_2 bacterium RIFCSPHIGHO2_02_FULL_48_11]